jgi:hypothetical protein
VVRRLPQAMGGYNTAQGKANAAELDRLTSLKGLRTELEKNAHVTSDAVDLQQRMDAALKSTAEATAHAAEVQEGYAGALADMADPVGSYEEILTRKEPRSGPPRRPPRPPRRTPRTPGRTTPTTCRSPSTT